jgi:hypothetical protein
MDPAYTDQLETIAARLPEEPCAVGLITVPDADWALAAAGDFAATVSRARRGHTILVSLASDRPDLDHELGAESELGLTDVLKGAASMKSVAARSRGRGYIYLPQGPSPVWGRPVLESRAWRRIRESALARGATLLVLLQPDSLDLDLDLGLSGLVLFGVSSEVATREGGPSRPLVLGALQPPAAPATPDSAVAVAPSPRWSRRPRSARASTMPSLRRRASIRSKGDQDDAGQTGGRRLRASLIVVFVVAALVALIALVAAATTGAGDRVPFLEQNDSLWQRPVPPSPAGDSTPEGADEM